MELTKDEAAARAFAVGKHGDQKYGSHPYVVHLDEVHAIAVEFGLPVEYRVAAFLHDVFEDTKATMESVDLFFGRTVTKLCWSVSGFGQNRKARNADAHFKMEEHPPSIPLKLCDRLGNGRRSKADNRDLFEMYKREYPAFKTSLLPVSLRSGVDCGPLWLELDRVFDF